MGYDIHITRADDWTLSADDPIALDEWLALAASSPLVEEDPRVDGGDVPAFRLVADPDGPALYWDGDSIQAKGGGAGAFPHVVDVAAALGAKVVGDDGEHYRADGTTFEVDLPDDGPDGPDGGSGPEPPAGRRRWFGRR